ncbi:MAG: 30S ribosomal protein S6 [Rickettsiales bacterium]|jgi:small subunit ribosomal protein S6|nr:30S ribosomal protein S6 [Rickettsiales bacterium]
MAFYENVFVLRQNLTTSQVADAVKKYEGIITEGKGKITKTENWGLRNLAYIIKKNRKGHYILFQMDCDPACMKELDRKMGLDEDVIRHMILRIDALTTEPSPILNQKDDVRIDFKKQNVATEADATESEEV